MSDYKTFVYENRTFSRKTVNGKEYISRVTPYDLADYHYAVKVDGIWRVYDPKTYKPVVKCLKGVRYTTVCKEILRKDVESGLCSKIDRT